MARCRALNGRGDAVYDPVGDARLELERIDYVLNEVARSVERGVLPLSAYQAVAPGYLDRRQHLLGILAGTTPARPAAPMPVPAPSVPARGPVRVAAPPRHVEWTSVLLFLGAFLVIVSAAFFAIVIWDIVGPLGKLGYLGALTAVFYGGGWWARTRLGLRTGSVALTAVASAALLLDGWVIIDGYQLPGMLPWAALLLVCSTVYWATEVMLGERFFGIVGVAAQVGWWWLLGDGLELSPLLRFAGIAVVAALWELSAQRARGNETFGALAEVLLVAAPVTAVVTLVGVHVNSPVVASVSSIELAAALGATVAASWVAWDTPIAFAAARRWIVAAPQLLFALWGLAAVIEHGGVSGHVAVLGVAAVLQLAAAAAGAGWQMAIPALAVQGLIAVETCALFDADNTTTLMVFAALAAAWALLGRFAEILASRSSSGSDRSVTASAVAWGSFAGLVVASLATPIVTRSVPLSGMAVGRRDVLVALAVLGSWLVSWVIGRRKETRFAGSVWSYFALASVLAWAYPDRLPADYALPFVALAGVWYASYGVPGPTDREPVAEAARCAARGVALASVLVGTTMTYDIFNAVSWGCVALAFSAAILFAIDSALTRSLPTSMVSAGLGVLAAALIGPAAIVTAGPAEFVRWWALSAAAGAVAIAAGALGVRTRERQVGAGVVSLTASAIGSLFVVASILYVGLSWEHVWAPFALLSLAWSATAVRTDRALIGAAAISAWVAAVAALTGAEVSPWALLVSAVAAGAACCAAPLIRRVAYRAAAACSAAGIAMLAFSAAIALAGEFSGVPAAWSVGRQGLVFALVVLAAGVWVTGVRWDREEAGYVAGALAVLAAWVELDAVAVRWAAAFSTPAAVYLSACGYAYRRFKAQREYPVALDVAAVLVGVGLPILAALDPAEGEALVTVMLAFGVCGLALLAGVLLKVRWYLLGGAFGLVAIAFYRSLVLFAYFWWIPIGAAGLIMLVVALTWERQRMLVTDARRWLSASFEGWR